MYVCIFNNHTKCKEHAVYYRAVQNFDWGKYWQIDKSFCNSSNVTRSDKTSLIAVKYTYSFYGAYHLFCGCYSNSVSFIEFLRIFCIYDEVCIIIACWEKGLLSFKYWKLAQNLCGNKTGFVRPGHKYLPFNVFFQQLFTCKAERLIYLFCKSLLINFFLSLISQTFPPSKIYTCASITYTNTYVHIYCLDIPTVPLTLNLTTHACSNCTARHVFKNAHNIFRVRTTDLWRITIGNCTRACTRRSFCWRV